MLQVGDTGRDSWTHILDTPYCSEHNLNIGIYRLARFWIPLAQFLTISRQNSPNIKNVRDCTWTRPVGRAVRGERCFTQQVGKFAYSRAQRDKSSLEKKDKKNRELLLDGHVKSECGMSAFALRTDRLQPSCKTLSLHFFLYQMLLNATPHATSPDPCHDADASLKNLT